MIDHILDNLRIVWADLEIEEPLPDRPRYVLQRRSRVILFVFGRERRDGPLVIVKLNRDSAQNARLGEYVGEVRILRGQLYSTIRDTIPPSILLKAHNGLLGVAEKALEGKPFETAVVSLHHHRLIENGCAAFADWLARFQACTASDTLEITWPVLEQLLFPSWRDIRDWDGKTQRLIEDICRPLVGTRVSLTRAYGDAHPSNILLKTGKVNGVVDWEGTQAGQWPVCDWFHFTLSLGQELLKARRPELDEQALTREACGLLLGPPDSRLARIMQEQTMLFLSAIGMGPEHMTALLLVFLAGFFWSDGKKTLFYRVAEELVAGRWR